MICGVDQLIVDTASVSGSWSLRRKMTKQLFEVFCESASIEETAFQGCLFDTHIIRTRCEEAFTNCVESAKFEVSHRGNSVGLLESDLQRSSTDAKFLAQLVELNRLSPRLFENVPHSGQETTA